MNVNVNDVIPFVLNIFLDWSFFGLLARCTLGASNVSSNSDNFHTANSTGEYQNKYFARALSLAGCSRTQVACLNIDLGSGASICHFFRFFVFTI